MMESKEILTKRKIEKLASEYSFYDSTLENKQFDNNKYDVFISHSSHDVEFIKKVLLFLNNDKGVNGAYVDWLDPDMTHETNAQTAINLKDRIKNAKKVIYVVTQESLKSAWCSWEIGYADCSKGINDIAILAIKPNNGRWKKTGISPTISLDFLRHKRTSIHGN